MNVVLICADDMPADLLSTMTYLDSNPQDHWVRFPNARLNTPLCGPSRVTHFTGRFSNHTLADTNDYAEENVDANQDESSYVASRVAATGNRYVAHIGKYMNRYPWYEITGSLNDKPPGWDEFYHMFGSRFYGWMYTDGTSRYPGQATYETDWSAAKVAEIIGNVAGLQPFVIWWNPQAPHGRAEVWEPAVRHENMSVPAWSRPSNVNETDVSDKPAWVQARPAYTTQEMNDNEFDRAQVIRMLQALDEGVETVVDALAAAGELDNTVIIFWSDNGYLFGEHRIRAKGVPYDEALRMGMMVRWPGVVGRTDDALVTNADIAATVLDICGATPKVAMDGMSIRSLVTAEADFRRDLPIHQGNQDGNAVGAWRGVVSSDGWKYVELTTHDEVELYDLVNDPNELSNVAASNPAQAAVMAERVEVLFS